jgi:aminomethyltransferase
MTSDLLRTPLYDEHVRLGAKLVPFAGWAMPVHYAPGILEEHRAVRTAAGLFDVSHMGEFEVSGTAALDLVQRLLTNDAARLAIGGAQYTLLCRPDGGVIDDCILYRLPDRYMVVVNAANRAKDRAWFEAAAADFDVRFEDRSDAIALLALQGPKASAVLARLTAMQLDAIRYYHFAEGEVAGMPAIVSRTGYTGEDGFELYVRSGDGSALWRAVLEAGTPEGILPVGLGARDTLRLEVGYPLYGNDLDEEHDAMASGLGWVVRFDKGDFIGRDALLAAKERGPAQRLAGFTLRDRGIPRQGYRVRHMGRDVGVVTSGAHSPSLGLGIGLAWIERTAAEAGTAIDIVVRDRVVPAEVVRPPFYKQGSVRR